MKYTPIDKNLFIQARENFKKLLKPKSIAFFNSNDPMPTNADGWMVFKQNSDIFYLTGIDQEETILVMFPDCPIEQNREILFIKETNEHIAVWEGYKYTIEHAREVSDIQNIYWTHHLESVLRPIIFEAANIYLNSNEHSRNSSIVLTQERRFIDWIKAQFPLHNLERSAPLMHQIRAIKLPQEITLIQEACRITELGFRRVAKFVKPNVMEYELEAEYLHEFIRNRSDGFAYIPIIASGESACVLHYIENNRPCKDGDILLLDVAANYANYNADLTRSIPVNRRFTSRQRQVYTSVLNAMKFVKSMMKPGALWDENQAEVEKFLENECIELGLLDKTDIKNQNPDYPAYKKYFMHGVSHFLGLDVHDVGNKYCRFEAGMVFTCEPGLYIPAENLGIRLENNILITENGNLDLMASIPIEIEEIEDLMNT